MNVLVVMPLGAFGGGAEQMLHSYLTSRHNTARLRLHILFLGPGALVEEIEAWGYPVRIIEADRVRNIPRLIRCQRKIYSLLQLWNIDAILAWMPKAAIYVAASARRWGIPMFMWRHDIPDNISRIDRWILRYCRPAGVACSSVTATRAFNRSNLLKTSAITVHPGIRRLDYDPEQVRRIRRDVLGAEGEIIVGTVVRLQPWKRVDLFLRASALVRLRFPACRFLVVGGESHGLSAGHGRELHALGEQLLGNSVLFAGERRDVGNWIAAMDAFVLPSHKEPFGISLVEALSLGKPVVACAGGGPNEIVDHTTVGTVLDETPTPEEMAEAIGCLLSEDAMMMARTANPSRAVMFSSAAMSAKIDSWLVGNTNGNSHKLTESSMINR